MATRSLPTHTARLSFHTVSTKSRELLDFSSTFFREHDFNDLIFLFKPTKSTAGKQTSETGFLLSQFCIILWTIFGMELVCQTAGVQKSEPKIEKDRKILFFWFRFKCHFLWKKSMTSDNIQSKYNIQTINIPNLETNLTMCGRINDKKEGPITMGAK